MIPWYGIYTSVVNAVWLTAMILRHAEEIAPFALHLRAVEETEAQREVLRFEVAAAEDDGDDEASVESLSSVGSDASLSDLLDDHAARVFRVKSLRPKQRDAVMRILFDEGTDGQLLVVDRTGGGKSMIFAMSALSVGGVTLAIIPLLSLTANQVARLKNALQTCDAVDVVHLDEIEWGDLHRKVIPKLDTIPYNYSSALFLLCSPQCHAETPNFCAALLRCVDREVLRMGPCTRSANRPIL